MATKGRSGRLLRRPQEPEDFELVEPAHVIRLRFQGDEEVSYGDKDATYGDEEVHFREVADDDPPERPSHWHARPHEYRPRRASTYDQIESEIDRLAGRAPSDDLDAVHRAVDLLTKDVRSEEEHVLREEVTEYVPKEETDRSAAAKKAAATRKKNQAAKQAAAKKAAAARKRKAAAKKAAETRRKNKEAREAAALKAAETRKKNQAAKEKAAKEAAEARKRKAAAKKAAETRRRNAEAARKAKEAEEAALAAKQAAGAKVGSKEYRPQCGAVTSAGLQCRNSARSGSKYCGSHKGYRPGSLDAALERTDTHPRAKKAEDTLPTKGTVASKDDQRPQCGAWTASNKQCRNSARSGSKYCASHKGYNPRSALKAMDTQPRWKKAEDTKPSLRT